MKRTILCLLVVIAGVETYAARTPIREKETKNSQIGQSVYCPEAGLAGESIPKTFDDVQVAKVTLTNILPGEAKKAD